jgi:hypothetical protein
MDNPFGGGLLEGGNSPTECLQGLVGLVFGQGRSNLFDHVPGFGFVVHVSQAPDFVLSRPFESGFMGGQMNLSFMKILIKTRIFLYRNKKICCQDKKIL